MINLVDKDLRVLKYCKKHEPELRNNNYLSGSFTRLVNLKYLKEKTDNNKEIYYKITKLGLQYLEEERKLDSMVVVKNETNMIRLTELEIRILADIEAHSPDSNSRTLYYEFETEFEDYSHCMSTLNSLEFKGYLKSADNYYEITELGVNYLKEHQLIKNMIEDIDEDIDEDKAFKDKTGKIYYDIDWQMIQDLGEHLYKNKIEAGGKYKRDNWKKDMNIQDMLDAIDRHFLKLKLGWEDEDHALALISNLMIFRYLERNNNK